jgi:hypothetical protein
MKIYNNPYAQKIYDLLSPMIGDSMAKSTIKLKTGKLGITEESIKTSDLPILAQEIKRGLVVFLGSDTAEKVADKISKFI